jgi:hypothetical protein
MQNEIDLWFVEPGTINSAALLNAYRALLTAARHGMNGWLPSSPSLENSL